MADDDDRQGPPRKRVRFDYDSSPRRAQNDNSDDDRDERQQDTQGNVAEDALPFPASERDRASMFFRMFLARMASPILHFTHSPTSHPPTTDVHDDTMAIDRDDEVVSHVEGPAPTSVEVAVQENSPPRTDIQARVMEIEQLVHGDLTDTRRTDRPTGDGGAIEDSNTDDEDLQQLSMVIGDSSNALLTSHSLATVHRYLSSEVSFDDVQELVFHSVKEQKKALVEKLFKIIKTTPNGADTIARLVQAEDEAGLSLLMICVRHEMLDLCEMLVNEGADVNQCNEKRPVALLIAAQKGHEDATRFLLERGANEESKNMSLIPAAHFGHLGVVRILLEFGADQNFSNKKGTTPLMRAAQEGRDEVVQFLIDKGAVAYAANNEGMTALMLAAQRGHANIATILITAGSDVNTQTRQGSTALLLAAKRGHTAAVEALMTAGADIFLKDDRHKTAAETAHRRGHLELFLKITVSNQIRLMREGLRRERYAELMRLSHLYVLSRATLAPAFKSPRRKHMHELLDRTMRLPRPLLQSIALFLPMCNVWDRQLKYLAYEAPFQPSKVVQNGIRILDDILVSVVLDARSSLEYFRRSYPQARGRHLALLRDSDEFRDIFMDESHLALYPELLAKLRRMADIQGALSSYAAGVAIQFGVEVAQDVVALVADMLRWDESRKRAMVRGSEPEAFTLTDYFTRTRVDI